MTPARRCNISPQEADLPNYAPVPGDRASAHARVWRSGKAIAAPRGNLKKKAIEKRPGQPKRRRGCRWATPTSPWPEQGAAAAKHLCSKARNTLGRQWEVSQEACFRPLLYRCRGPIERYPRGRKSDPGWPPSRRGRDSLSRRLLLTSQLCSFRSAPSPAEQGKVLRDYLATSPQAVPSRFNSLRYWPSRTSWMTRRKLLARQFPAVHDPQTAHRFKSPAGSTGYVRKNPIHAGVHPESGT